MQWEYRRNKFRRKSYNHTIEPRAGAPAISSLRRRYISVRCSHVEMHWERTAHAPTHLVQLTNSNIRHRNEKEMANTSDTNMHAYIIFIHTS